MKKLLTFVLAVLMILPLCISVSAAETDSTKSFSIYTGGSSDKYNTNRRITVVLNVRDIYFGEGDGISALEFDLYFDKNRVTPITTASEDEDGDSGDFTKLIGTNPGDWEGFGYIDSELGLYSLAFSDISGSKSITEDDDLVIKIPFLVNDGVRVNDMVFSFDNVIAYNKDMTAKAKLKLDDVVVHYSMQPPILENIPGDAIPVHVAGYRHDINNVIYYAEKATTIGNFVARYCEPVSGQNKMSKFAIIIAGLDGIITYMDLNTTNSSDKSSVVIPAEHYVIGISGGNSSDCQKIALEADLGKRITLYNINIETTGKRTTAVNLSKAGFAISEAEENKPPVIGGDDPEDPITPPDNDDPNTPDDPDKEDDDFMLGDINENGIIDSMDYVYLKRAYFGTYALKNQKVGDINKNNQIDSMDYVYLKRAYFGTYVIKG